MTVAEEVGLEGANALDGSLLTGSTLINLDSEEDGVLTVGCAGSTDTWIRIDAPRAAPEARRVTLDVIVRGGQGGHSGMEIAIGRSNAIKVLGRALREAHAAVPFRLVSLDGGKSRNAIPRDAHALVSVESDGAAALRAALGSAAETIRDAFSKTDPGVTIEATRRRALRAVDCRRDRAPARRPCRRADRPTRDEPRLRRSRRDVDVARRGDHRGRPADPAQPVALFERLGDAGGDCVARRRRRLGGGSLEVKHNYSGWRPDLDSAVLAVARTVFETVFGAPPVVTAVHAGLETSVIGGRLGRNLDMLSFGPADRVPPLA